MKKVLLFIPLALIGIIVSGQDSDTPTIKDLGFLIGKWEVREDNEEQTWWEESIRVGTYVLDSTYIELKASATSKGDKQRTYLWLIHFNSKAQQFEMISMFSNWPKIQFDTLSWDADRRKLTIQNGGDPNSDDYHDRFGEILFDEDFNGYTWKGRNLYGDKDSPDKWVYIEKGKRIDD